MAQLKFRGRIHGIRWNTNFLNSASLLIKPSGIRRVNENFYYFEAEYREDQNENWGNVLVVSRQEYVEFQLPNVNVYIFSFDRNLIIEIEEIEEVLPQNQNQANQTLNIRIIPNLDDNNEPVQINIVPHVITIHEDEEI